MKDVIIIKKKGRGAHAAHHGGAWKVAFADFMTAMMCFFLVMWLISQNQSTRAAIAAYFRDPGVFETTSAGGLMNQGTGALDGAGQTSYSALVEEANRQRLQKTAKRIEEEIAKAGGLKGLEKQVDVQVTSEGLRIELQDTDNSMFFDSGSARIHPESERVLALIAQELEKLARPVVVEGHTDSRPYGGDRAYSNWDLSADRANAARRVMESGGLSPARISAVRGFADRRPRILNDPLDARNRRVSIVVPLDARASAKQ
jgi:chemotaxis protein MotB